MVSSVVSDRFAPRLTESRSLRAASGSEVISSLASSDSEYTAAPMPPRMARISTAALTARGMRARCSASTMGDSA